MRVSSSCRTIQQMIQPLPIETCDAGGAWNPALLWHFTESPDACTEDVNLLSKFSANQANATTVLCEL